MLRRFATDSPIRLRVSCDADLLAFFYWQLIRWTDCECLATLVCWFLFCYLEAPPSASVNASSIGNAFDGPTASVLPRLSAGFFSVIWKPLLLRVRTLRQLATYSVRLRVSCEACLLALFYVDNVFDGPTASVM
jgi:hypothetical protein